MANQDRTRVAESDKGGELACDEDDAAWDERLRKVVAHKPALEPEPE